MIFITIKHDISHVLHCNLALCAWSCTVYKLNMLPNIRV